MRNKLEETGKTVICGKEYTIDELRKGVKNPFYEKLIKEVVVPIRREDYAIFEEVAKLNDEPVEVLLKRCMKSSARRLQQHESPPYLYD